MKALALLALLVAFPAQTGPSIKYGKDGEFSLENMTPEGINVDFGKETVHAVGHGSPALARMLDQGATLAGNQLDVSAAKANSGQYEIQKASAVGNASVEFDSQKAADFRISKKLPPLKIVGSESTKCTTTQFTYEANAGVGTLALPEAFHIVDQQVGPIEVTPKVPGGVYFQSTTIDAASGIVTLNVTPDKIKNRIRTANLKGGIHFVSDRSERPVGLTAVRRLVDASADRATLDLTKVPGELIAEGHVKVKLETDNTSTMEFDRLVLTLDPEGKILSLSATGAPTKSTYLEKPKSR